MVPCHQLQLVAPHPTVDQTCIYNMGGMDGPWRAHFQVLKILRSVQGVENAGKKQEICQHTNNAVAALVLSILVVICI